MSFLQDGYSETRILRYGGQSSSQFCYPSLHPNSELEQRTNLGDLPVCLDHYNYRPAQHDIIPFIDPMDLFLGNLQEDNEHV